MKIISTLLVVLLANFSNAGKARMYHLEENEFNKKFDMVANEEEMEIGQEELSKAEKQINEQNEEYNEGESMFFEGLNPMSDMPQAEFEREREGLISVTEIRTVEGLLEVPKHVQNNPKYLAGLNLVLQAVDRDSVPAALDGRAYLTEPKDQGLCGSCASFATAGIAEGCIIKAGGSKSPDLSEQYMLDCGYDGIEMKGCDGAFPHGYAKFLVEKAGGQIVHEHQYPYMDKATTLKCPFNLKPWKSGALVRNFTAAFNTNEEEIKSLIWAKGPVLGSIYASEPSFKNYAGGIYSSDPSKEEIKPNNHAIIIAGYGEENGVKYWIIKNSWGKNWGENGYARMIRGSNTCGIEKTVVGLTCEKSGMPDAVPPPPPPPPANVFCDVSKYFGRKLNGVIFLKLSINGKMFEKQVKCSSSICTPYPTANVEEHACMGICGAITC